MLLLHSCSPDLLARTLDPVAELVDTIVPSAQSFAHIDDLALIQHLGLDPCYPRNLCNLIDGSTHKTQAECLHDQVLNLVRLNLGLLGDLCERHGAVVGWAAEDGLGQSGQADLLIQEVLVLLKQVVLAHVCSQDVVGAQITLVEGDDEITQPSVLSLLECVEDRVEKKFTEVVDGVGDQSSNREVVCDTLAVFEGKRFEVDACEVEKSSAVVGGELVLGLVVVGANAIEGSVYDRLNRVECVENLLALVEILTGFIVLLQAQVDVCYGGLCIDEGVL